MPIRSRIGQLAVMLILLTQPVDAGLAGDADTGPAADSLISSIDSLRCAAEYHQAAGLARELFSYLETSPTAMPYELLDAKRLIGELEFASSLPESQRLALADADRLTHVIGDYESAGRYPEAEDAARREVGVRRRLLGAGHPSMSSALGGLAWLRWIQGDSQEAESLFTAVLALDRSHLGETHPNIALGLQNLAVQRQEQGDLRGADSLYREALRTYQAIFGDRHPDVARVLANLGVLLDDAGRSAEAEPLLRAALSIWMAEYGHDSEDVGNSLSNLAILLLGRGDRAAAEAYLREALDIYRQTLGEDHPAYALCLANLSHVLQDGGELEEAEALCRRAMALNRRLLGEEHPQAAIDLNNLATFLYRRGQRAEAERLLREAIALEVGRRDSSNWRLANSLYNLGNLLWADARLTEAETCLRRAVMAAPSHLGGGGGRPNFVVLAHLGGLLRDNGDTWGAERALLEACRLYDMTRANIPQDLNRSRFGRSPYEDLAAIQLALGSEGPAWASLERARGRTLWEIMEVAAKRDLSPAKETAKDSLQMLVSDLEHGLAVLRERARTDSSYEVQDLVEDKQRALLEAENAWAALRQGPGSEHPTAGIPDLLSRVQAALSDDQALIGWLGVLWPTGGEPELDVWGYAIRRGAPVAWRHLVRPERVARGSGIAADGDGDSGRHAVSALGMVPGQSYRSPVVAYRAALSTPATASEATLPLESILSPTGAALFSERIAPLLPHLEGVRHLIVIPSGEMLGIPIEALPLPDGRWLGEQYTVSYAPSATIHTWLRERAAERAAWSEASPALLLGDPPFNEDQRREMEATAESPALASAEQASSYWALAEIPEPPDSLLLRSAVAGNQEALARIERLPGTRFEVESLKDLWPGSLTLLGTEASEQRLVELARADELRQFRVLHLATHALVDPERPEQSCLLLSRVDLPDALEAAEKGERIYDGLLTVKEILQEWKLDADLVTLSGCETALGQEIAGEGYVGFAHAFLQAGARSLLVSLWRVEDEATALLMRRFYGNLFGSEEGASPGEPMSKRLALQEAKAWLRGYEDPPGHHPFTHPFYWAAFVLVGEGE